MERLEIIYSGYPIVEGVNREALVAPGWAGPPRAREPPIAFNNLFKPRLWPLGQGSIRTHP